MPKLFTFRKMSVEQMPAEGEGSSQAEEQDLPPLVPPNCPGASVLVVGAGRMGQLIVGHLALRGSAKVVLYDRSDFTRERAVASVRATLNELEKEGLVAPGMIDDAIARIDVTESLDDAVSVDLIIEAVPEDLALKREIFQSVDKILTKEKVAKDGGPLLCSNSISLAPTEIFQGLKHKRCAPRERAAPPAHLPRALLIRPLFRCPCLALASWCNMRFLSPVYFIDEVELIADDKNGALARGLLESVGCTTIPKMTGEKMIRKERVLKYYARQREHVAKSIPKGGPRGPPGTLRAQRTYGKLPSELPDCSVCLTRPSGALILPCGHTSTCHDCAIQLSMLRQRGEHRCPICRGHIEKVLQADCPVQAEIATDGSGSTAWNFFSR